MDDLIAKAEQFLDGKYLEPSAEELTAVRKTLQLRRKDAALKILVCNTVAQSVIERQRGKHPTHVFVYRRERVKNKHLAPTMQFRPITRMSNSAWYSGREAAGLGDLHLHDLRHTVGLRMREAGVLDRTQDDILWHSRKTMTAHYAEVQLKEIFEALKKIKDESNRFNISLSSMIREAKLGRLTQKSPTQKKTG